MAKRRRGNDGDSYNRRILRKIEHKTHISETIEEFDPDTGRIVRREVRTKDIDAKITEDEHPYSVPQRLESGQTPVQSDRSPLRIPEQWKVSVFDSYTDAPLSVADFAGDYVVSRVSATDDDQIIVWESAFVECQGLSCLRVTANAEHQHLKLTAEFTGRIQGPRWTGVVNDDLHGPIQLQRDYSVPPADYAEVDWPLTVTLVAMGQSSQGGPSAYDSSPRYISPEPTVAMRAMMAGGGSSSSSSGPPLPPFVPPCPPDTCCPTSPPGTNPPGMNPPGMNPPGMNPPGMNPPGMNPPGMNPPGLGPGDFDRPTGYSMSPVRYFDGQLSLSATDFVTKGFGFPWGQTRSYSNKLNALDEGLGYNWIGGADPYLVEDVANNRIAVVHSADSTTWFADNSGSYSPLLGSLSSLTHDSGNGQYKYTDPNGQVTIFNDFDDLERPGMFIQFQSEGGNSITVTATSGEMITEMQRSQTVDGITTTDSFVYTFGSSGASLNRLESVVWRQKVDAGTWTNILRVTYSYYGDSESFGSLGDLKTAMRGEWNGTSWSTLGTSYYRYYKSGETNGFEHGLRYALNEQAFQNLSDDPSVTDPFTASNALVSLYADYYFEYDSQQRVTRESVKGGSQTFTFSYIKSSNTDDVNNWENKTVETLPDGTIKTVYTNYVGQPLLQDFQSGSDHWLSYIEYNSDSRVILRATPAAITSYNDSSANLGVVLKSSEGLIYLNEYYSSTGSGGAKGYLKSRKIKEGASGTAVVLILMEYTSHSAGGSTIYPVSKETTYTNDNGTGAVSTEYNRTYHSGTVQIDQKTTILPTISISQNGSGTANSFVKVFDIGGYLIWLKDERGFITRFKYNTDIGSMIQRIDDVDTAQVTDEPSGWVTPTGGGLHLITDYESDRQGRITQELGPVHTIDIDGTATDIRTANWIVYKDPEFRTVTSQGYQKSSDSSFTLVNPVSITKRDKNGNVLEQIQATRASTSGKLLPTDTFAQSSYTRWSTNQYTECCLLTSTRAYYSIPSSGEGISGTNYDQTDFGYDTMNRRNRTVTPGGTITFLVYDARGMVEETWIGTDDTGASQTDPSGGGASGNNMVIVSTNQFDSGNAGSNGNLTKRTQFVTASDTRVTTFEYDWRDRQIVIDDEVDFYEKSFYDNRNLVVKTERYDTTSSGHLIGRSETKFDNLGRTYQSIRFGVDPSTGTVGNALTDNTWYSETGQVIKQLRSGSKLFSKMTYDGLGRNKALYTGYDLDETSYAEAFMVTGDTILEQTITDYDDASNIIDVSIYQRFHDATGTGELNGPTGSQPKARISYVAYYQDGAGRTIATADYGTNGSMSFTRSAIIPTCSDDILVFSMEFDSAGNIFKSTVPVGMVTYSEYDDAGRQTKEIENYVAGGTGVDENRTTEFAFNADGNLTTLKAVNSTTGNQVTTYEYGTTLSDSEIATSTLLKRTYYPDATGSSDHVDLTYNRLFQQTTFTDQNGSTRAIDYDKLGRPVHDRVTTLGSGVDGAVLRLSTTYEVRGMIESKSSYNDATIGQGDVVNEVKSEYNDFGQLATQYQQTDGGVNTSITPKVQYAYANGLKNTIRATSVTYPNGRQLNYDYGTTDSTNDVASRVSSLIDADGTSHLVDYEYLGVGSIVETDYPEPNMRNRQFDPSLSGDIYNSLDRFGRIIDFHWYDYADAVSVANIKYGYDRDSNRLWREDVVAAANGKHFDELYAYDGLQRLLNMQRGSLNAGHSAISNKQFEQNWLLDATENWSEFKSDDNGNGTWDLNQSRTSNVVNEITNVTESAGPSWSTPAYDATGNMVTVPKSADPTGLFTATYDAWNRLVKLEDGVNTVQEYEYDARRFRTVRKDYSGGTLLETRHFYYSSSWQSIEERVDSSPEPETQNVWGRRYIDDCVLRDRDTDANGIFNERLYALQDANWNIIAIIDENGDTQERYNYTAYGTPSFWDASFNTRSSSSYSWNLLYASYCFDATSEFFYVRNRYLHTKLGLWITRDPLEYKRSRYNLYAYCNANPIDRVDPSGYGSIDKNTCQNFVNGITKRDPAIKGQLAGLGKIPNCVPPEPICGNCNPGEGGGYNPESNKIIVCTTWAGDNIAADEYIKNTLVHELIHKTDDCQKPLPDPKKATCDQITCIEARAYTCSNDCNEPKGEDRLRCVARRLYIAIKNKEGKNGCPLSQGGIANIIQKAVNTPGCVCPRPCGENPPKPPAPPDDYKL